MRRGAGLSLMVWRTTWRAVAFGVAGGVVILTLLLVPVVVLNAVGAGDRGTDWAGSLYLWLLYYLGAVIVGAVVGVGAGAGSAAVLACQRPLQHGGYGSPQRLVFAVAGGAGAITAWGLIVWRAGATGGGTGPWFAAVVGTITTWVAWTCWPAVTRSPERGAFEAWGPRVDRATVHRGFNRRGTSNRRWGLVTLSNRGATEKAELEAG